MVRRAGPRPPVGAAPARLEWLCALAIAGLLDARALVAQESVSDGPVRTQTSDRDGDVIAAGAGEIAGEGNDVEQIDVSDIPLVLEKACFNSRDARDFDALGNDFVLVEARRNTYYLLTLFPGCYGLRSTVGIAIASDSNRVCSNTNARLVFRSVGPPQICPISSVEAVENREIAREIVEGRKRPQEP